MHDRFARREQREELLVARICSVTANYSQRGPTSPDTALTEADFMSEKYRKPEVEEDDDAIARRLDAFFSAAAAKPASP